MSTCLPSAVTWTWAVMFAAKVLPCTVTETCSLSMSGIMTTEVMYCPGTCRKQAWLAAHLKPSSLYPGTRLWTLNPEG